jgi:hypothetical protein
MASCPREQNSRRDVPSPDISCQEFSNQQKYPLSSNFRSLATRDELARMDVAIPSEILARLATFGELLRYFRRRAGLTQTSLSIAVDISRGHRVHAEVGC